MKDFIQFYHRSKIDQNKFDPLKNITMEIEQQFQIIVKQTLLIFALTNIVSNAILAPFQTIVSSLQLSVKPHKRIFQQPLSKSTQVTKATTSLSIQQKRKLQLMMRTQSDHKPYTAPVYQSYWNAIKGIKKQGLKAFYKGLFFRSSSQIVTIYSLSNVKLIQQNDQLTIEGHIIKFLKLYSMKTFFDCLFNTLNILQNRYILQSNIPQFKVYRNSFKAIQKILKTQKVIIGCSYHFFKNIGEILLKFPNILLIVSNSFSTTIFCSYLLFETINYPLNTAFRRLLCQSEKIPGLIPIRYKNINHAVRLIYQEQGLRKGLYSGFSLYQASNILRSLIILLICGYKKQFQ